MSMRLFLLLLASYTFTRSWNTSAFSPHSNANGSPTSSSMTRTLTQTHRNLALPRTLRPALKLGLTLDPSHLSDLFSSTIALADDISGAAAAIGDAVGGAGVASDIGGELATTATDGNGWFGFLTIPIIGLLQLIHAGVSSVAGSNSWGISIIALTVLIKVVTFPLTKTQLESTTRMQAMQPAMKEIQNKYQSNPEVMNQKMAEFYQQNNINPLAGCLPSLLQIPIFIGLYRAVLDLAKDNKLNEPFLFLPSLEGPTYGADPATANDWIYKGLIDGTPVLGWDDTIAFLVLPLFLVISQYASVALMQPKTDDPQQQQSNAILKVLPLMIGWFALSVPSALSVYWATNNIVTTATSLWIKNSLKDNPPVVAASVDSTAPTSSGAAPSSIFAPPREKPSGFGRPSTPIAANDEVKPITVLDAEIVTDDESTEETASAVGSSDKKKRRKGRKKKN